MSHRNDPAAAGLAASEGLQQRDRRARTAGLHRGTGRLGRAGAFPATRLAPQVRQALENVVAVLAEAGGRPEHLVRLTWYVTSRDDYYAELAEIGAAYRAVLGRHFPTMSVVQVVALMEADARVEIEATAVIPDAD